MEITLLDSIWHISAISVLWKFGHIHYHWPNWPSHLFWPFMVISLLGPTWPFHHHQALPGLSLLLGPLCCISCIWPNTPKDTFSLLKPPKPKFHSYPFGIGPKDLSPQSTTNNQKCHKWCYTPLCTFFHQQFNGTQIKWLFQLFIQVIKEAHHPEDSSSLKARCQSQVPMTSSSNCWLFLFTISLQGNTGNILSRDIQEAAPKPVVKCQCFNNPTWQPNSFQYSLDSSRPVFQSYIMGKSFNTVHFPIWQGIHPIRQSIQLLVFNTDQLPA
ncbi:hypothetical protein O181_005019 [Austropuccinia psidii MF-1]|uniref:Uncharacterized protein n=1 Tax=Austropuccinia psidii MF-1 TaxID=1389203 RepID=A0A9Q3BHC2_9BASI|nr:hypothetical protein [Austropuccinia psidii MF-1]